MSEVEQKRLFELLWNNDIHLMTLSVTVLFSIPVCLLLLPVQLFLPIALHDHGQETDPDPVSSVALDIPRKAICTFEDTFLASGSIYAFQLTQ